MDPIIEKNIPLPAARSTPGSLVQRLLEIYARMEPGDSFMWDENKEPYRAAKQMGVTIATRKINAKGWRVWLRSKRKETKNL